jgi:hypothetical protein
MWGAAQALCLNLGRGKYGTKNTFVFAGAERKSADTMDVADVSSEDQRDYHGVWAVTWTFRYGTRTTQ